jgi:hypothetical protein
MKKLSKATLVKRLEKRCDELWAEAVKKRDHHRCRFCGKGKPEVVVQAHHIIKRGRKSLRWDTGNGIALCSGHHGYWAHLPGNETIYTAWLEGEIGRKQLDFLNSEANRIQIVTYAWLQDVEQKLMEETR